ncbi:hypothetical protein ACFPOE_10035 [Caenimonas terrae]|uniref:PEP-CTERM sorting domain-containing protein n=1 Tax=Caenimonas terrae TaxID=696074 RepID=A0ABW0NB32_9BURK
MGDAISTLKKIKEYDDARPGFPGEHWIVLGAGIGLWLATRRRRSMVVQALGALGATALAARAASGREGLSKVLRYTPLGGGIRRRG